MKALAALWVQGEKIYEERGEVLFGDSSLSGICLFNLSARMPRELSQKVEASLDLLEEMDYRQVLSYLERQVKAHPGYPAWELFAGVLNLRAGEELMKELSVPREALFCDLTRQQLRKAAGLAKAWRFGHWNGRLGKRSGYQGGVPLKEVDLTTMESKKRRGLYLAELRQPGQGLRRVTFTGPGQPACELARPLHGKKGENMLKITEIKLPGF